MKHRILFATLMSLILSCLMTAWVTWLNLGFTTDFIQHWLKAWISAWPAAGIISFTFAPMVQKVCLRLTSQRSSPLQTES
ncbi:DUF2798 domain-containing protein [Oceanospirillum beijerinckii]|uniref:DUF2798 domain-containing protein n=1 Tax=Oceanospirillum beijerinckii TaxID=64976 RepID=UPI0004121AA2|nr:DUF2798 domain-containing protein [Oceanospirillum beijerinckii]MAC47171.1 DUF2798 domain-containing protein [Oceanospirillum sp.]